VRSAAPRTGARDQPGVVLALDRIGVGAELLMRHRSPSNAASRSYSVSVEPSKSNTLEPVSEPRLARHEAIKSYQALRRDVCPRSTDVV